MIYKNSQIKAWKTLIVLLLINYQVITIGLNDLAVFKYLRDLLLIYLIFKTINKVKLEKNTVVLMLTYGFFCIFLVLAVLNTDSLKTIFLFFRKYLFPVGFLYVVLSFGRMTETIYIEMTKFLLNILSILSIWGIFQAYFLGDKFLMLLGYPTVYSNAYSRMALKSSFYFGNLGIQRVVSTLSNSNVFALILGIIIITIFLNYDRVLTRKSDKVKFACIVVAYVMTFSRANFLAMLVVAIFCIWKYIPNKKYLFVLLGVFIVGFSVVYIFQEQTGLTHKLVGWVFDSLSFKESSAAGRSAIWATAFRAVSKNPLGIGFGKVGSIAQGTGTAEFYHCENSYLAMALDLGWLGVISYIIFLLTIYVQIRYYAKKIYLNRRDAKIAVAIMIYFMIACFFSNHIYDMEVVSLVYFLEGLLIRQMQVRGER